MAFLLRQNDMRVCFYDTHNRLESILGFVLLFVSLFSPIKLISPMPQTYGCTSMVVYGTLETMDLDVY